MWAHRPWVGRFYPAGTRPGTELGLYARWCNAVEGNTTFYATPSADTVDRWREQTPDDFRFAFKLPRIVTHDKRLRDVAAEVRGFLDAIEPLGERIGPIQAQLPPSLGPADLDALLAFLRRLPRDLAWALEVRHPSFFDGSDAHRRLDDACLAAGVGRVVLDTRPLYAVPARSDAAAEERRTKPSLPIVLEAAGPHPIVRVIGEDDPDGSMRGLLAWVPTVAEWLRAGRTPYVFAHQPENLESPGLARAFHEAVTSEVDGLVSLLPPPGQASMF